MKNLDGKRFPLALLASLLGLAQPALAADWRPDGVFVEAGAGDHRAGEATVGVMWAWDFRKAFWGGELTADTEVFASHWSARASEGRRESYTLVGVQPLLRYRFSQGRSPWFAEAGIGVSVMDNAYNTPAKRQATRFNFYDSIAVGRNFGLNNKHEVSLRLTHLSNADIKKPNPGEEFLALRYALRF
jgi:lipid A 3-O-deacylase